MKPDVTVLVYTARDEKPFAGKAKEMHCFEPVLRTLTDQTHKNFELVLVDALWETRPYWFNDHPQPFPVKHVPSSPNYWQQRGWPGLCAQINRGIAWADGDLIWMGAENNLFPPTHVELIWSLYKQGHIPVAWYGIADKDHECGSPREIRDGECPETKFDLCGFTRNDIATMDHRAARFAQDPSLVLSPCHNQHYFGYSSIPTDVAIAINGFDELFDSQITLFDCDVGSRLEMHGVADRLIMHRNLYVIEPPAKMDFGGGITRKKPFKCNYAMLLYNQLIRRSRANTALPDNFVEDVKEKICQQSCALREDCSAKRIGEGDVYPFCEGDDRNLVAGWLANAAPKSLENERELRKARLPPYNRGWINGEFTA